MAHTAQHLELGTALDQAVLNASAAWDKYHSTVVMRGTPEQRKWALDQAVNADQRAADLKHQPHTR